MKTTVYTLLLVPLLLFTSCIGDDIVFDTVEPTLRITNALETIGFGESHQFTFTYRNNIGAVEQVVATWESSDETIIAITPQGLATGIMIGEATLTASFDNGEKLVSESIVVNVGEESIEVPTIREGTIKTTSSYKLTGDFTMESDDNGGVVISIKDNYEASTALPGLYIYLTNNPNTSAGALEIGAVTVFQGAHQYNIPNTGLEDYSHILYFCKPFNVKVGDGLIE